MDFVVKSWGYVFSTVLALLPIVNPLATIGVLLSITTGLTERERNEQTRRACIYMAVILISFLVAGGHTEFPGVARVRRRHDAPSHEVVPELRVRH